MAKVTTLFLAPDFEQAPVVDANGRPIGILTKTDVLRWHWQKAVAHASTVGAIMSPVPLIMPDHTSIARASVLLTRDQVDSAVVVSSSGRVTGLLSCQELLAWLRLAVSTQTALDLG